VGATLPSAAITSLTLAQCPTDRSSSRPPILQRGSDAANKNYLTVRSIDISKVGAQLVPHDYPVQRSYHTSLGVQRQLRPRHVLSADFVRRVFVNELYDGTNIDLTVYNRTINGVQSPVIPVCPTCRRTPLAWSLLAAFRSGCRGAPDLHRPAHRSSTSASRSATSSCFLCVQARKGVNGIADLSNYASTWGPTRPTPTC